VPGKEHPLLGDYRWAKTFSVNRPLCLDARLPVQGEEKDLDIWWSSHCREVLIYWFRDLFRKVLVKTEPVDPGVWSRTRVLRGCPDFTGTLGISTPIESNQRYLPAVIDLIARIPLLLLDPQPVPRTYRTVKPPPYVEIKSNTWTQVSASVIYHPALLSVALGLFRQAVVLVSQGFAKEVLKTVNLRQVRRILNQADQEQALQILEKIRPWVEIPSLPRPSSPTTNYFPFPWVPEKELRDLSWNRLIQLHQVIRACGLKPIFGEFEESWSLQTGTEEYSGACSFWGSLKKPSPAHKQLENLVNSL